MCEAESNPFLLQNLKGHKKNITCLKFHPDEKNLVSSSEDASIMIWNIASKDVRSYKFSGHSNTVTDVDCAPNGKLIASSSLDRTIRLWVPSVRGGCAEMKAHTSAVKSIAFSPNNQQLCSGSNDKSIKVWDVHRKKFMISFIGHNNWVNSVKFTPDGKNIVSCADDKSIRLWDVTSKECINVIQLLRNATKIDVHTNGTCVAAAMSSGSVRIYDIFSGKLQQHYILHEKHKTTCVAWHPAGNHLLTCGTDGTMRILDVIEGRPLYTLEGTGGPISSVAFSPDGEYFACAGADMNVLIWKTNFIQDENSAPISVCSSNHNLS